MSDKPQWEHDCEACIFLGSAIGGKHHVDLYAHESPSGRVELIARYGDDGPDYASTELSMARPNGHAELFCAKALYGQRK